MATDVTGQDRLLLLDGHSLAYRAFFALPIENFSTVTGQPTNAIYGFTAMLINVLRDEKPTHLAVAFDRGEPTFRHEQYVEYKANRRETPEDFRSQLSLIFEVLDALGIRRLSAPGYEADDLIATLATQAAAEDMDVLIVTGDRDVLQLVSDRVTALMTRRGISDMTRFTPETVAEKYGLTPAQYPDFAALRGDPSDNLPGIPGVGEKTATKWIAEFGSLAALVDRVDEVKGKAGDALREHLASVLRNRQLTALVTDLPAETVGAVPGDLLPVAWDRDKIHQLFDSLEFKVLRERLYQTLPHGLIAATGPGGPQAPAEPHPEKAAFEVVTDLLGPDQVSAWLAAHESTERSGLTLAGTWGRGTGNVTAMAIAAPDGHGAHLDPAQLTEADERALAAWLADPGHPKVLHDAKGPMHALVARGLPLAGLACDTALAAYLALPGQRTFDLADLALRYLGKELREEAEDGQLTLDGSGERDAAAALVLRAQATLELAAALEEDLDRRESVALLRELELPLIDVLAKMERTGIAADSEHFAAMSSMLHGEAKAAEQAAYAVAGHEFNLGSPKQLQELLFNELGLPKTKRIKTGYTTDSEALTSLLAQTQHPVLEHLLRHRDVAKLMTIVDSLIPMAGEDGRIHTTFNQTVAATGRLSSTDPNLQNIPIRSELGRQIRLGFVVGNGLRVPAVGGLQPDRAAHHGPPVRRRGADRGVRIRARLPRRHRLPRVRDTARGSGSRAARQDQGDELRAGLRPVRLRARQPAAHHAGRGTRADGGVLQGVRRRPGLPARGGLPGPDGRLHRHHDGPPPVPARPDLGQQAAPRDGRTDGAQRPDPGLGRGRDQGSDAGRGRRPGPDALPDAAPGPRRAHHRGGAGRVRCRPRHGLRRDGGRRLAAGPARRVGRHRPKLG